MLKRPRFSSLRSYAVIGVSILLLLAVSTAQGYTYNILGDAGGWDDVEKTSSPTYVLDRSDYTTDGGLSPSQIDTALTNAFDTWAAVDGSSLSFTEQPDDGGNYDLFDGLGGSLDQSSDPRYANITFGGWLDDLYFSSLPGALDGGLSGILAVAWTGKIRGGGKPTWVSDIYFNDEYTWNTTGIGGYDIETVMLHELGHSIGLGHEERLSEDPPPIYLVPAVMNPVYAGVRTQLYDDDIAGVISLYAPADEEGGGGGKPPWAGGPKGLSLSSAASVPEPATLLLLVPSLAILVGRFKKRS